MTNEQQIKENTQNLEVLRSTINDLAKVCTLHTKILSLQRKKFKIWLNQLIEEMASDKTG